MGKRITISKELIRSRVTVDVNGCWVWTMSRTGKGYGQLGVTDSGKRKNIRVPRLVWELWHGEIPNGRNVLHRCDTPSCCNPEHLFIGTNLQNIKDSISKHRWNSKLTWQQVEEIKRDPRSTRTIARDFGIHHSGVSRIKNGLQCYAIFK